MKIGILNFHRALNYGAVLQCYGLQETLTALGHEVSVIDYRPKIIEKHRSYFLFDILKEKGIIFKDRYHILDQLDKKEPLAYYLEKIAGDRK